MTSSLLRVAYAGAWDTKQGSSWVSQASPGQTGNRSVCHGPRPRPQSGQHERGCAEGVRGTVLQKETPRYPSGNPWGRVFPVILPVSCWWQARAASLNQGLHAYRLGTDWVLARPGSRHGGRGCGTGVLALSVVAALMAPGQSPRGRWQRRCRCCRVSPWAPSVSLCPQAAAFLSGPHPPSRVQ